MSKAAIDLGAYLSRIGYDGPLEPTHEVLRALVWRHVMTFPFDGVDPFLGRGVPLDPAALHDKMIRRVRGGYCFETNSLMHHALAAVGFTVSPRLGRVIRGVPVETATPRVHLITHVEMPDGAWLVDVGFGNLTPTAPLAVRPGEEQATPLERYRIVDFRGEWLIEVKAGDAWQPLYRMEVSAPVPVDVEVGNWFTATHPESPFVANLVVSRPVGDHRVTLLNRRFGLRYPDGRVRTRPISDAAEYEALLVEKFGIELEPGGTARLLARIDGQPDDPRAAAFFA